MPHHAAAPLLAWRSALRALALLAVVSMADPARAGESGARGDETADRAVSAPPPAEPNRDADFLGLGMDEVPLRLSIGVGLAMLAELERVGDIHPRTGAGVDLRLEFRGLSWAVQPRRGFSIYDALYSDGLFGRRVTSAVGDESDAALALGLGYQLLPGVRGRSFGAFAGMRAELEYWEIGDSTASGWSFPIAFRSEARYHETRWLMVEAWASVFGDRKASGIELDIGVYARTFLALWLSRTTAEVDLPEHGLLPATAPGASWKALVGLRAGSIY